MLRPLLLLYNLLLPLLLLAALPRMLRIRRKRGGYSGRFGQRLNRFDPQTADRLRSLARQKPIWLHAVSVGEVNVAVKWIDALRQRQPDCPVVLSTTTTTGFGVARDQLGRLDQCEVIYSPLDLLPVVNGMLRRLQPRALVLVEAEVWPNWVWRAHRLRVPVFLVNARLSPRSRRRYQSLRRFVRPLFALLDEIHVQEPADAEFWRGLGLDPERVQLCGSVKYDDVDATDHERDRAAVERLQALLTSHGHAPGGPVVLLASTHPGEETALVEALKPLRQEFEGLRIWIAPRHVERATEIIGELEAGGYGVERRSLWRQGDGAAGAGDDDRVDGRGRLLLIDTTGELKHWQQLADVVVVGKSFLGRGGQNPAEAVAAGKPVITGPHMDNFSALMQRLEEARGIARLPAIAAVPDQVRVWLRDPDQAAAMADRGRAALAWHHGAALRSVDRTLEKLPTFHLHHA